jgi:hypothetical protein
MAFWSKVTARRGIDEVGSVLLRYVRENFEPLQNDDTRQLVYWSDRCRGQTNNWYMICLFKYLIGLRFFTSIDQKFLCTGHSFLDCDRLFAMIEKRKKVCQAFVPNQWVEIIRSSATANPFHMQEMIQDEIMEVKLLKDLIPLPHGFKVTECAWVHMNLNFPSKLYTRQNFAAGMWFETTIVNPHQPGRIANRVEWQEDVLHGFVLRRKYVGPIHIHIDKYRNLLRMLPYLHPQYRAFYQNLLH